MNEEACKSLVVQLAESLFRWKVVQRKLSKFLLQKLTWLVFCNKKIKLASQNESMRAFLPSEDNEQTIDQFVILRAKFQMSFHSKEKDKFVINVAMMKRQGKVDVQVNMRKN